MHWISNSYPIPLALSPSLSLILSLPQSLLLPLLYLKLSVSLFLPPLANVQRFRHPRRFISSPHTSFSSFHGNLCQSLSLSSVFPVSLTFSWVRISRVALRSNGITAQSLSWTVISRSLSHITQGLRLSKSFTEILSAVCRDQRQSLRRRTISSHILDYDSKYIFTHMNSASLFHNCK